MAYVKNEWVTGDVITAEKLNHIEDGVVGAGGVLLVTITVDEYMYGTLSETGQTIKDAFAAGTTVLLSVDGALQIGEGGLYTLQYISEQTDDQTGEVTYITFYFPSHTFHAYDYTEYPGADYS